MVRAPAEIRGTICTWGRVSRLDGVPGSEDGSGGNRSGAATTGSRRSRIRREVRRAFEQHPVPDAQLPDQRPVSPARGRRRASQPGLGATAPPASPRPPPLPGPVPDSPVHEGSLGPASRVARRARGFSQYPGRRETERPDEPRRRCCGRSIACQARIREIVEQYRLAPSVEAFGGCSAGQGGTCGELGTLVTGDLSAAWDDEPAIASTSGTMPLPDLAFTPTNSPSSVSPRAWSHATLAGPAAQALRKLRASGVEPDPDALAGVEPRLATSEPPSDRSSTPPRHRAGDLRLPSSGTGEPAARHVQPWGLTNRSGRWYLTGLTPIAAPRVFRLPSHRPGHRTSHRVATPRPPITTPGACSPGTSPSNRGHRRSPSRRPRPRTAPPSPRRRRWLARLDHPHHPVCRFRPARGGSRLARRRPPSPSLRLSSRPRRSRGHGRRARAGSGRAGAGMINRPPAPGSRAC